MSGEEMLQCPSCQAELVVPEGATEVTCKTCQEHIDIEEEEEVEVEDALPPGCPPPPDDSGEWELVDVNHERHHGFLLASAALWMLGLGLWFAPGLPAGLWGTCFVAAGVVSIAALFPKRSRLGFVLLGVTLLSAAAFVAPPLIEWRQAAPERARRSTPAADPEAARISSEIARLQRKRRIHATSPLRDRLRVDRARVLWRRVDNEPRPIIEFFCINRTQHSLAEATFQAEVSAPDQPDPIFTTRFTHALESPLAPGDTLRVSLVDPEPFHPLAELEQKGRGDLRLDLQPENMRDADGRVLIEPFTDEDQAELESLQRQLERLPN